MVNSGTMASSRREPSIRLPVSGFLSQEFCGIQETAMKRMMPRNTKLAIFNAFSSLALISALSSIRVPSPFSLYSPSLGMMIFSVTKVPMITIRKTEVAIKK